MKDIRYSTGTARMHPFPGQQEIVNLINRARHGARRVDIGQNQPGTRRHRSRQPDQERVLIVGRQVMQDVEHGHDVIGRKIGELGIRRSQLDPCLGLIAKYAPGRVDRRGLNVIAVSGRNASKF